MLKIRLQRIGRKNDPSFRVVLTDRRNSPKSGKFLEVLGSYAAKQGNFEVKADRVKYWISKGANVSDTMHNFLVEKKIIEGKKVNVVKVVKKAVETPAESKPAEPKA
jgi:small subunit ribosomal protein S16